MAEAVAVSELTITCVRSHNDTRELLETAKDSLAGKVLVELSTGDSAEAEALMSWTRSQGAGCLIGMIAVFPKDIGKADSAILAAGDNGAWESSRDVLKTLAGKSALIGPKPDALAAIYASLVLPRQAFMFGMIWGAMICRRAGVSM